MDDAFVGRERELGLLLEGFSRLSSGRGSLFLVSGEAGIGKSRLTDELCTRAAAAGAHVVWGAAWDGGGAPAYWPWVQVVRALRSALPEPDALPRAELGPMWGDEICPTSARQHAEDAESLRFRRFDALRAVLQSAAARGPLVVVLEDLHAADRASLLALQFVSRCLRSLPVLVVGTHRDPEVDLEPALADALTRLGRDGTVLELGRLCRQDVARLVAGESLSSDVVDTVFAASGGNPLSVRQVVKLVRGGGATGRAPIRQIAESSDLAPPTMVRGGDIWTIAWGSDVVRLKHSRGVEILHTLVSQPGREFHVLDFVAGAGGDDRIDAGDAGEVLDPSAKNAYRQRVAELEDELREAEAWADSGRCERLRAELDFLRDELARSVGLGGRDRRVGQAAERARINVQKRLRCVVRRIADALPDLGRHLESELRTGTFVSYLRAPGPSLVRPVQSRRQPWRAPGRAPKSDRDASASAFDF